VVFIQISWLFRKISVLLISALNGSEYSASFFSHCTHRKKPLVHITQEQQSQCGHNGEENNLLPLMAVVHWLSRLIGMYLTLQMGV
jgi:hypothetical protein